MKRLLIPLLVALVLPTAVNSNEKASSEISEIEANKILTKDKYFNSKEDEE